MADEALVGLLKARGCDMIFGLIAWEVIGDWFEGAFPIEIGQI